MVWFSRDVSSYHLMMEWLFHCNTSSLRKHKAPVPCSVLLSNNYAVVKACSKNIWTAPIQRTAKKSTLQFSLRLSFQCLASFLGKKKSGKCTYFATGRCFIHPPLIFATHRLILALQHLTLCITLLSQRL